jgi:LAO/AO transport system kinase
VTTSATRPRDDPVVLAEGVRRGERASVARMLSLVEGGDEAARPAIASLAADGGHAYTIGITGAPGAGKSSLTDRLVSFLRSRGDAVSVLAVDPSSPRSGGAILGDRVRMGTHATDPGVFIRSMATRGQLGGLAAAAPQAVRVLDASGSPWILVETVGVGQVELDVAGASDTTVVVVTPGWGDGVQANKAGLLEVADVFVVNKADRGGAEDAVRELRNMLRMGPKTDWTPPIVKTSTVNGEGTDDLWDAVEQHRKHQESAGTLAEKRRRRILEEVKSMVAFRLRERTAELLGREPEGLVDQLEARTVDPYQAAEELLRTLVAGGAGA